MCDDSLAMNKSSLKDDPHTPVVALRGFCSPSLALRRSPVAPEEGTATEGCARDDAQPSVNSARCMALVMGYMALVLIGVGMWLL